MSEIERLRALLTEGTARPWHIHRPAPDECDLGEGLYVRGTEDAPVAFASSGQLSDAALIAAAVNALPALLDVAEAATAEHRSHRVPGMTICDVCAALDRLDGAS